MSDSSKRLPSTSEDTGFEGYEHLGTPRAKQSQLPLAPGSETGVRLPPGISDLKDWGPKNHHEYLTWVLKHGADRGGRLEDLCLYLKAIKYDQKPGFAVDQLFPGTHEIREKKVSRAWIDGPFGADAIFYVRTRREWREFLSHCLPTLSLWFLYREFQCSDPCSILSHGRTYSGSGCKDLRSHVESLTGGTQVSRGRPQSTPIK